MIVLIAAFQAVMAVPASPAPPLPAVTSNYSIVVARAVRQTDPKPIDCGRPFCTSWFLGHFDQTQTIAGSPLADNFVARIEMGSPFDSQYELALIVEQTSGGDLRVRAQRGFHFQSKLACFDVADTQSLEPQTLSGKRIVRQGEQLCVK